MAKKIKVACYGETQEFNTKEEALKFYMECMARMVQKNRDMQLLLNNYILAKQFVMTGMK